MTPPAKARSYAGLAGNCARDTDEQDHVISLRTSDLHLQRLRADGWRMPCSGERSCLRQDQQSVHTDPPEPAAPEGFLLPSRAGGTANYTKCPGHRPERETRIPGLAQVMRVPKSAGPVGGNEA
ncbi:hypothetical protein BRAO285_620036 [Bradyrhizobium sp. ORS 285]|nr:hypothetical protein BRAO285_620036 [Bradyrhizobium sp. ORS 285]